MAKKHRKPDSPKQIQSRSVDLIPSAGKKLIAGGIAALLLGFAVLTRTDPFGRNWASHLAPFLILGAYGVIFLGIVFPENWASFGRTSTLSESASSVGPNSSQVR